MRGVCSHKPISCNQNHVVQWLSLLQRADSLLNHSLTEQLKSFSMPLKAKVTQIQERERRWCWTWRWRSIKNQPKSKGTKTAVHTHINETFPFVYFKLSHISTKGKKMHRCCGSAFVSVQSLKYSRFLCSG